ncbi:MAG: glycosyltransferase family 4 protein [Chloroflexi bacterium]|nr:glycosyltransferase family 4 protein [Chloroflexota bacterium]
MKKVLVVDYYFPPLVNLRTLKFVKYLPGCGWEPVILTVSKGYHHLGENHALLDEVPPAVHIYRTFSIEPVRLVRLFRSLLGLVGKSSRSVHGVDEIAVPRKGLLRKIASFVAGVFVIPDHCIGWLPFALVRGLRVIKKDKVDVIYSVSFSHTSHLIAYLLKRMTGKPWVADFRDPWTWGHFSALAVWRPKWRLRIEQWMESAVLKHADRVISVSEPIINDFKNRHYLAEEERSKFVVIPNGFDPEDFVTLASSEHSLGDKFKVTYTGAVTPSSDPKRFLNAVNELVKENKELQAKLSIAFVGKVGSGSDLSSYDLHDSDLKGVVEFLTHVPYKQSLEYMKASDVLLLIINVSKTSEAVFTGKIFNYLGARKPILALAPTGVAADLIREARAGIVVAPDDVEGIKKAILELYSGHKLGLPFQPDGAVIQRFERTRLTGELAKTLDEISVARAKKRKA